MFEIFQCNLDYPEVALSVSVFLQVTDTSYKAFTNIQDALVEKKTTLDTVDTSPKEKSSLLRGHQTASAQKEREKLRYSQYSL